MLAVDTKEKSLDKLMLTEISEKIRDEKIGHIINNSKKVIKRSPPTPLNTSKALVLLTKNLP